MRCADCCDEPALEAGAEDTPVAGGRRSRVVLDRPTDGSLGRTGLDGVRCDVERSREGVTEVGGEGAGRYDDGALGFFGGAGGTRYTKQMSVKWVMATKTRTYCTLNVIINVTAFSSSVR